MSEYGYKVKKQDLDILENIFSYHAPNPHQQDRYEVIRQLAKNYVLYLLLHCPRSNELQKAIDKVEESVMLANASIARNEPNEDGVAIEEVPFLPVEHIFSFLVYLSTYPEELKTGAMNESPALIEPFQKYCETFGLNTADLAKSFDPLATRDTEDQKDEEISSEVMRKVLAGVVLDFVEKNLVKSERYFYKNDIQGDDPVNMRKPVVKVTIEYSEPEDEEAVIQERDKYEEKGVKKKK